jgi:hypothetical protein
MSRTYDKDPYVILGIPPTATASQVKQAYRRLAREYHPDLNKDSRAIERMKDINWANDILSDGQERSLYDLWRNSSVRVVYYPGTNPPPSSATPRGSHPPSNPPPSAGNQTRSSPPSKPPPRTTYSNRRVAQGWPTTTIALIIIIVLVNVTRMIKPVSQPSFSYSLENIATQTALEGLISTMETFRASQEKSARIGTVTPSPFYKTHFAPSPTATILRVEFGHEDSRLGIAPGSWEWGQIHYYFPELTTPDGLSDEVTDVIYDQLRGYQIKTRNSGEYWLFINVYDNSIAPAHFPPTATVIPIP